MWISKAGFVRIDKTNHYRLEPGKKVSLDFTLKPGEVLSGKIDDPFWLGPPETALHVFRVRGEGFEQIYQSEPGGTFEIYVPQGIYSIEVLTNPKIQATGIRAGTKNLVLRLGPVKIAPDVLAKAFDNFWQAMDAWYSYFAYKPDIDWNRLREIYRPRAIKAATRDEFIEVLKEMLASLKDMHVWIQTENEIISTFSLPWQRNWNPTVVARSWKSSKNCGQFAIVGKTQPDGFGFVVIKQQSSATAENVKQTVDEIRSLSDVPGFIVDLRGGASGGNENLAQQFAQAFCSKEVVYAKQKYRNGPAHDAFSEERLRTLPAGNHPFTKPVVCLIGQKCMSSGEGLVKMMDALPHVTLVGMRTRGASGNPKPVRLDDLNLQVLFSRWVDMQPDGTLVEGKGISPDFEVNLPVAAYENDDATWNRALEVLREKVRQVN